MSSLPLHTIIFWLLCVYFGEITKNEAEDIFNNINSKLTHPTKDTFEEQYRKAFIRFERNGWKGYLGI